MAFQAGFREYTHELGALLPPPPQGLLPPSPPPRQVISVSAAKLCISPRLQDHDDTSITVALALAAIEGATEAATVIHGSELLSSASADASMISKAVAFAKAHRDKSKNVPQAFWNEFAHLEACAGAQSRPLLKAVDACTASPPPKGIAKEELAEDPSATSAPSSSPASAKTTSSLASPASFKSPGMKRRKLD